MNGKRLFLLLAICALAAGWIRNPAATDTTKHVIGQTVRVEIAEAAMEFIARVDTGAATTSVHAESVRVDGDMVDFELVNRDGTRLAMRMPVAKRGTVRNSGGSKRRVFVEMTLNHGGQGKRVLVNLSERNNLTYALLLGRNWLKDDYIVDVSHEPMQPAPASAVAIVELQNLASSE